MSDFENFKFMLSHGFPSNKIYYERNIEGEDKIIEKKRVQYEGFREKIVYEQFIFDKITGEFISWQSMLESCKGWK